MRSVLHISIMAYLWESKSTRGAARGGNEIIKRERFFNNNNKIYELYLLNTYVEVCGRFVEHFPFLSLFDFFFSLGVCLADFWSPPPPMVETCCIPPGVVFRKLYSFNVLDCWVLSRTWCEQEQEERKLHRQKELDLLNSASVWINTASIFWSLALRTEHQAFN